MQFFLCWHNGWHWLFGIFFFFVLIKKSIRYIIKILIHHTRHSISSLICGIIFGYSFRCSHLNDKIIFKSSFGVLICITLQRELTKIEDSINFQPFRLLWNSRVRFPSVSFLCCTQQCAEQQNVAGFIVIECYWHGVVLPSA